MSVSHETVHPLIRKLATTTCVVALLPIGMGALVTTLKAGMAFADWPSSDGHNMLLYPWFRDFSSNPEKFTEHGHRLAGMLIGFISVVLAAASWRLGKGWVRTYAFSILVAVILQGLLGGARVLFDRRRDARRGRDRWTAFSDDSQHHRRFVLLHVHRLPFDVFEHVVGMVQPA